MINVTVTDNLHLVAVLVRGGNDQLLDREKLSHVIILKTRSLRLFGGVLTSGV